MRMQQAAQALESAVKATRCGTRQILSRATANTRDDGAPLVAALATSQQQVQTLTEELLRARSSGPPGRVAEGPTDEVARAQREAALLVEHERMLRRRAERHAARQAAR